MTDSPMPSSLHATLSKIGVLLRDCRTIPAPLAARLEEMNTLSPCMAGRFATEIATIARLYTWRKPQPIVARLLGRAVTDRQQLVKVAGLNYLFLFHRDGHLREAALEQITGALPSAFVVAAIALRLNDWVGPVRRAAARCVERCFPLTSATILAEAALALMERRHSWRRWNDDQRDLLDRALARVDVCAALAEMLAQRRTGPIARALRFALRRDHLDHFLPILARDALQPEVRAVAAKALIDGYASWADGWQWRWVDKSMGLRRAEPSFARRAITGGDARGIWVAACVADKAAVMRKLGLSAMIRFAPDAQSTQDAARMLAGDRSRAVRERAEFILRRHGVAPARSSK